MNGLLLPASASRMASYGRTVDGGVIGVGHADDAIGLTGGGADRSRVGEIAADGRDARIHQPASGGIASGQPGEPVTGGTQPFGHRAADEPDAPVRKTCMEDLDVS
jgi:hypothetical protein